MKCSTLLAVGLVAACGSDDGDGDLTAPLDAAAPSDALLTDAQVVDCTGDHRESRDRTNDPLTMEGGEAEATGFVLRAGSDPFTVCGQIDPAQANDMLADGDFYEFTVGGDAPVNVRLELLAPDGAEATDLAIDLHRVEEGTPVFLATGPFRTDYGVIAGVPLEPGTYWVNAVAFHPVPAQPVLYTIAIQRNTFSCPIAELTYSESSDGTGRGNDTVSIDYGDLPPKQTADEGDAPEATGIELAEASGPVRMQGVSLALASDGDSYLDRDAYLVSAGPETNEVEVRLGWPGEDVDLDVYLFEAGDPENDYSVGLGTTTDKSADELFTVNIDPDRSYWLWVGAYQDATGLPVTYNLTVCPRTHGNE